MRLGLASGGGQVNWPVSLFPVSLCLLLLLEPLCACPDSPTRRLCRFSLCLVSPLFAICALAVLCPVAVCFCVCVLCAGCWLAGGCVHFGEPSASEFAIFTQGRLRPVCLGLWSRVVGFSYRASRGGRCFEINQQSRLLLTAGSRPRTITTYMYSNSSLEQK